MKINRLFPIAFATLCSLSVFFSGCGGEPPSVDDQGSDASPAPEKAAGESSYAVIDVSNGGVVRGTVSFAGVVPAPRTVSVSQDAEACGHDREIHGLRVAEGGGLTHAVVSLVDISAGAALRPPTNPTVLDQRRCTFEPHVVIAPVGEVVEVLNNDPITHNIHTVAFANRPVNRAQPSSVRKIDVSFMVAEKVRVRCDMHEWMGAWIVVVDHPYHAVTDASGDFVLEDVPPGTYTMEVWHETLGAVTQEVTVLAGEESKVTVEMASTEER